jgi:hypothetical protein
MPAAALPPAAPQPAADALAAAVAAVAAAAADPTAAPQYDTLTVGFELDIELLHLTWQGEDVKDRQVVGKAKLQLRQLLGHGGLADVYLGQLQSYEATLGQSASSSRSPQQLVVKIAHPPAMPLPDAPHKGVFLGYARADMWKEYTVLKALAHCEHVIDCYGFGIAAAGAVLFMA